jgi:uncharacterized protein (DUF924 family)
MATADEIIAFWFGSDGADETVRRRWFVADAEFDRLCLERFAGAYAEAVAGSLEGWQGEARANLALVLLLDQCPRNMFRNSPRAFATDAQARAAACHAMARGFDRELPPLQRVFLYMPFQHSEALADQDESVRLTAELARAHPECADFLKYAEAHREVIRRFGRFPHRNAILGRAASLDETAYMRKHSGF